MIIGIFFKRFFPPIQYVSIQLRIAKEIVSIFKIKAMQKIVSSNKRLHSVNFGFERGCQTD